MVGRRCLFCGECFSGQKSNFEHVIPAWLVREADLTKRTMPVVFRSKKFQASMNRIGGKVCEVCNNAGSALEGKAQAVYSKIRDGFDITITDGRVLLDWLDKVRIGIWLWGLNASQQDYNFSPKFYINQRLAAKDRIALILKVPPGPSMKGFEIWGASEFFMWTPSVFGFLSNNIVMISISTDFLLTKHLFKITPQFTFTNNSDNLLQAKILRSPGSRLKFFGNATIFGQCILPKHLYNELELEMANASALHPGLGEGPVIKLDSALKALDEEIGSVKQFTGNVDAQLALMEINLELSCKYILGQILSFSMDEKLDSRLKDRVPSIAQKFIAEATTSIEVLNSRYARASGIRLPWQLL